MHKLYANAVLQRYWDGNLPVDIIDITNKMGIQIESDPSLEIKNHSGCVRRLNENLFKITYNPKESIIKKRFAIAHEIGHISLGHMNDLDIGKRYMDTFDHFDINAKDPIEREANKFALELLIPEYALGVVIGSGKAETIRNLTEMFCVSRNAMKYRLIDLGYI